MSCSDTFQAEVTEIQIVQQDPMEWEGGMEVFEDKIVTGRITTLTFTEVPLVDVEVELGYVVLATQAPSTGRRLLQEPVPTGALSEVYTTGQSDAWRVTDSEDTGKISRRVVLGRGSVTPEILSVTFLTAQNKSGPASPAADETAPLDTMWILVIVGAAIVFIVVIVIVYCLCSRRRGARGQPGGASPLALLPPHSDSGPGQQAQQRSRADMIFMNVRLPRRRSRGPARDAIP